MHVRALLAVRLLVVLALFPALAGCATQAEPLTRGDIREAPPSAAPVVPWARADEAEIRPGVLLRTETRDCPTSFLFARPDNGAVFLATTAHCTRDLPIGSLATVGDNASHIAILVYNSFQTMHDLGEDDPNALSYNDFAVFHLDGASRRFANPTLPGNGPTGLADGNAYHLGDRLRALARNTPLPRETDWRDSIVTERAGEWALLTYTVVPGAPGSLGGPVIDPQGRAVGVLATLGVFPNPGANGVARLDTMMSYARTNAGMIMDLAEAT